MDIIPTHFLWTVWLKYCSLIYISKVKDEDHSGSEGGEEDFGTAELARMATLLLGVVRKQILFLPCSKTLGH